MVIEEKIFELIDALDDAMETLDSLGREISTSEPELYDLAMRQHFESSQRELENIKSGRVHTLRRVLIARGLIDG